MIKMYNIFKIIVLIIGLFVFPKLIALPVSKTQVADVKTDDVIATDIDKITVDWINADEQQNLIRIHCSFSEKATIDAIASGVIKIEVNTRKKEEETLRIMYVQGTEVQSENTLIITVQPLLKAAIYGAEKRDFVIRFIKGETITEILKTVVLSTSTQFLDLRSYTVSSFFKNIRTSVFILIFITLMLVLAIPIVRKYNFKKYHIKKYRQVTHEDKAVLDPFTFESIEENDQVVVIDKKVILLRSWKRLRAMHPEERTEGLNAFFSEDEERSHLFKPLTHVGKNVNRMWFGMIGAYMTWLLYIYLIQYDFEIYRSTLSSYFDTDSEQFSTIIYGDTLLAALLGITMGMTFIIAEMLYAKHRFSFVKAIFRWILGILFLIAFFGLQFFLNMYEIDDILLAQYITWLCIGTGMAMAFGIHLKIKKIVIMAIVLSIIGFGVYQVSLLKTVLDTFNTQILFLFNLLILGSIAGGLSYKRAIMIQKAPHGTTSDVVDDNNTMTVQVN